MKNPESVGKAAEGLARMLIKTGAGTVHIIGRDNNGNPLSMVLVSEDPGMIQQIDLLIKEDEDYE